MTVGQHILASKENTMTPELEARITEWSKPSSNLPNFRRHWRESVLGKNCAPYDPSEIDAYLRDNAGQLPTIFKEDN
jgi:hypothetical protein